MTSNCELLKNILIDISQKH